VQTVDALIENLMPFNLFPFFLFYFFNLKEKKKKNLKSPAGYLETLTNNGREPWFLET
jgi:hypothetical protein